MKKIFNFLLVSVLFALFVGLANPVYASEVAKNEEVIFNGNTGIIADNDTVIGSANFPDIGYTFIYSGKTYVVENYAYSLPYGYHEGGYKEYYVCTDPQNKYFMIRVPDYDNNLNNDYIIEKVDNAGSPWKLSTCNLPYVKQQPYIYSYAAYQGNEAYGYYFYYSPTKVYFIGQRTDTKQYYPSESLDNLYGSTFKFNSSARYINLDKLNKNLGSKNNINNIDDAFYFENLTRNFGNNIYGSCSYVAIAMMMGYYDSLIDNRFVNGNYINPSIVYTHDISEVESPGTTEAYHQYLLSIGSSLGLSYGIYSSDFLPLLNKTLQNVNNVSVNYLLNYNHPLLGNNNALSISQIENGIKNHIDNNNPVILLLTEWDYNMYSYNSSGNIVINSNTTYSHSGHAMVAYGYVTYNGETYYKCHLGWYAPTTNVLVKINGGEVSAIAMENTDKVNHNCSEAYIYDLDGSLSPMCFCPTAIEQAKFIRQPFESRIDTLSFETTEDSQVYSIGFSTNFEVDLYVNGELIPLTDLDYNTEYIYDYNVTLSFNQKGTQRIILHAKNYSETNLTYAIFIDEHQIDGSTIFKAFFDWASMEYVDGVIVSYEIDKIDITNRTITFKSITLEVTAKPSDWFYQSYVTDIALVVISGITSPDEYGSLYIYLLNYDRSTRTFVGTEYNVTIEFSYYDFKNIIK